MFLEEALLISPELVESHDKRFDISNELIPYSTGFEIECIVNKQEPFRNINNLVDFSYSEGGEVRFRIKKGFEGFQTLFEISKNLNNHAHLNPESGIHYHIDFTDIWNNDTTEIIKDCIDFNKEWILNELESWNYTGSYNRRDITFYGHTWIRFNSLGTMEFRLGNMTFDYKELCNKIIHANSIAKRFKKYYHIKREFGISAIYRDLDINKILKNRVIPIKSAYREENHVTNLSI